jgi:hypothetical protein
MSDALIDKWHIEYGQMLIPERVREREDTHKRKRKRKKKKHQPETG